MGFLSHKYGNKFLLPAIKEEEFVALKGEIVAAGLDNGFTGSCVSTRDLIEVCYRLDENQVPSVYRLLSTEEIIEGYNPNVRNREFLCFWSNMFRHFMGVYFLENEVQR